MRTIGLAAYRHAVHGPDVIAADDVSRRSGFSDAILAGRQAREDVMPVGVGDRRDRVAVGVHDCQAIGIDARQRDAGLRCFGGGRIVAITVGDDVHVAAYGRRELLDEVVLVAVGVGNQYDAAQVVDAGDVAA